MKRKASKNYFILHVSFAKNLLFTLTFCCYAPFLFSQTPKAEEDILIEFKNGVKVNREEFEYVYQKNNGGPDSAKKHSIDKYKEYLDLYIKFKRKVMEAESLGLDTTENFKLELNEYVTQSAQPYLIEKSVLERLIQTAYQRSKMVRKVSHLLLSLPEQPTPEDTLAAYQRILAYRDSILKGKNIKQAFEEYASRFSQEPNANQTKGYLSYFTAFDFVYPFEEAAFNTPIGKVSMPVRSKFGYHIIYVHEEKALKAPRKLAHILVRYGPTYPAKDSASAVARIQECYQKLKNGEDFAKLAETYSDDPNTNKKGGDLGTRYLPIAELQDKKYEMEPGQYSQPFRTSYGWHIVKVTEEAPFKPFEQSKNEFKQKVTRDGRAQVAEDVLVANLKKQYNFKIDNNILQRFKEAVKDQYTSHSFTGENLPPDLLNAKIITFADQSATIIDLLNSSQRTRRRTPLSGTAVLALIDKDVEELAKKSLLEYEKKQLARKYPEFRRLQQEYRDGILLFSLTEQKVWRKAVEDTVGLKNFYENNKNKFQAGERVRIKEYRSRDKQAMESLDSLFNKGATVALADTMIIKRKWPIRTSRYTFDKTSPSGAKYYSYPKGHRFALTGDGNSFNIQIIEEFLQPGIKSYEEAKSEVITQYQNYLEEQWLNELANKYPCTVNEKVLLRLYK
ncbi:MAG: peptidylprolyl isomerase [Bacteroidia bacterium]|nr:peptidylprolyl isomerase [Bacteroidia bacterium]